MLVGVADHAEQRLRARVAVHDPVGIEDLVPAVLRVRLRKHHELDVGRVAVERCVGLDEVVDLVVGERETQLEVRALERRATPGTQRNLRHPARLRVGEEPLESRWIDDDALGHAVVQVDGGRGQVVARQGPVRAEDVAYAALDPSHRSSPQTCAMSVALLDHGDTVPKRGTTKTAAPGRSGRSSRGP
jgi:hypothetical protein